MNQQTKLIGGFVLGSSVCFALLSLLWLVVGPPFSAAFRPLAQLWMSALNRFQTVQVQPIPNPRGLDDSVFIMPATDDLDAQAFPFSAQQYAYTPPIMVVAFVLATPLAWRRRMWALLLGAALALTYTAFRLEFALAFAQWSRWEAVDPGGTPWLIKAFGYLHLAIFRRNAGTYVIPVLLWIAATFRKGDVQAILAQDQRTRQNTLTEIAPRK